MRWGDDTLMGLAWVVSAMGTPDSLRLLYRRETHVPEKGVVVPTVRHSTPIGMDRDAETMAFPASPEGEVARYLEVVFEPHGYGASDETLDAHHERIVAGIRSGDIVPVLIEDEE